MENYDNFDSIIANLKVDLSELIKDKVNESFEDFDMSIIVTPILKKHIQLAINKSLENIKKE